MSTYSIVQFFHRPEKHGKSCGYCHSSESSLSQGKESKEGSEFVVELRFGSKER